MWASWTRGFAERSRDGESFRERSNDWVAPLLPWDAARYVPPLERLADKMVETRALLPPHAMPIEPRPCTLVSLHKKGALSFSVELRI